MISLACTFGTGEASHIANLEGETMFSRIPDPGVRMGADQVREVYVHGRLEHRLLSHVDTVRGFRVPVLNEGEDAHFTMDGKCYIVRRTFGACA